LKLTEIRPLAYKIVQDLEDYCSRIEIAGSIRRERAEVNDIDIVLIPKPWAWMKILGVLKNEFSASIELNGPQLMRALIPIAFEPKLLQVDFYVATEQTWGTILLIRTGSKEHNIKLCSWAKSIGLMLSAKDGVIKEGKVVASKTEEDIFKALLTPYVRPQDREA
jgi:DNA polymerase/3'-5' exonuclease PolX